MVAGSILAADTGAGCNLLQTLQHLTQAEVILKMGITTLSGAAVTGGNTPISIPEINVQCSQVKQSLLKLEN